MAFGVSNALSMLGGSPLQKAGTVFIEKLKAAKTLDGGDIGNLLKQVLASGNLNSVLQDPTQAANSGLLSQLSSSSSAISSALGGSAAPLISAMSSLSSSVGNLGTMTSSLSGLTAPGTGQFGLSDLVAHSNLMGLFGSSGAPSSVSMASASAPLQSSAQLQSYTTAVQTMETNVIGGSQTISNATAQINGYNASVTSIMTGSTSAMSTLQNALANLSLVSSLGASITGGTPEMQIVVQLVVQPLVYIILQNAAEEQFS